MTTYNFKHQVNGDGNDCYLTFSGMINQQPFTDIKEFTDKISDKIDTQQINFTFKADQGFTYLSSMDYAITFSLGMTDYSNYIQHYKDCCFHQTFQYNGKTYITIIKNNLLNELIQLARTSYMNVKKTSPDNIYIRIDSTNLNNNHITNTTPTQEIEKYLSVNHISSTPTKSHVSLIGEIPIKENLTNSQVKKLKSIFDATFS